MHDRPALLGDLGEGEARRAEIENQLVRIAVGVRIISDLFDDLHTAVSDKQIQVAVTVQVGPLGAEAGIRPAHCGQREVLGAIVEISVAVVDQQGVVFGVQMRKKDVLVAVEVKISSAHAHAGLGEPGGVVGGAGEQGGVLESLAAEVDPQLVRVAVVGDIDIRPGIAVEVGADDAQAAAIGGVDACGDGHVAESRRAGIAGIAEQPVRDRIKRLRTAVVAPAGRAVADLVLPHGEIHIVGDEQIDEAVPIVIHEGGAGAPAILRRNRAVGNVRERSVAIVAIQRVRPEVGDVQIGIAVVVEVRDGDAHAVPAIAHAGALGHINETQPP